jgi:hypothetical protein
MPPSRQQFPPSGHVFVAMVVNTALAAVMLFWCFPYLRRISGGLEPFDLRPFGYTLDESRAFLFAISSIGSDFYADVQLSIDNIFAATYALSRGLLLLWLTQPGRTSDRPIPWGPRLTLLALPTITAGCDVLENSGIAAMLAAGPQLSPELVARASFWTEAKWLATLVSETTWLALAAIAFMRRGHARAQSQ